MKTIYLIRHAEAEHPENIEDFDRPLSENGHQEARKMAKHLVESGYSIDGFFTSPAKRAATTCRYFAETFGNREVTKVVDLYEPFLTDFISTIANLKITCNSIAIFSHNNGITEFGKSIDESTPDFPTCGVGIYEINTNDWRNFQEAEGKLVNFFKPKDI